MEELEMILRQHWARYPQMQPTDAVKLIYQNAFGGGHMIRDEEACRNYLRREYAAVVRDESIPRYEDIGNGIVRVKLASVSERDLEWLAAAFIRSAAEHKGTLEDFKKKLLVLCRLTEEGVFSFSAETLYDYLVGYETAGYPAVSHSQVYRDAYHPAYRIVLKKYCI